MPKISVIVPVYNVEKYINRCIESISIQSFTDFECILVDDCSPDNSGKICDEFAKKDGRFFVIHKPQNEGLPKARKTGLDISKGDFVIHVDSDDWLETNALELLVKKQQEANADIVLGGFKWINSNGSFFEYSYLQPPLISPLEYYFTFCDYQTIWAKLTKRELWQGVVVPPYSMGEDTMYSTQVFSKLTRVSQITTLSSVIYNYDKRNENNLTNTNSAKHKNYTEYPNIICLLWVEKYVESLNLSCEIMDTFRCYMIRHIIVFGLSVNALSRKDFNELYDKYYLTISDKTKLRRGLKRLLKIAKVSIVAARIHLFFYAVYNKVKALCSLI